MHAENLFGYDPCLKIEEFGEKSYPLCNHPQMVHYYANREQFILGMHPGEFCTWSKFMLYPGQAGPDAQFTDNVLFIIHTIYPLMFRIVQTCGSHCILFIQDDAIFGPKSQLRPEAFRIKRCINHHFGSIIKLLWNYNVYQSMYSFTALSL